MNKPIVFARMDGETVELTRKVCKSRGENVSTFVRRSVLRELARLKYLEKEDMKALEVTRGEVNGT